MPTITGMTPVWVQGLGPTTLADALTIIKHDGRRILNIRKGNYIVTPNDTVESVRDAVQNRSLAMA